MKKLIRIKEENGKKLVSARELHEGLGIKTRFSLWIEQYIKDDNKYGFEKDLDFTSVVTTTVVNNGAKRELQDYALTTDIAKEISMLTGTEIGRQFRKYFIECEKQLVEVQNKAQLLLSIYNGGQEGVLASKQLTEIEVKEATQPLLDTIEEQKPMVEFANQIGSSSDSIDVGTFAKVVKDENINIGRNRLFQWLRDNKYLMKSNVPYQNKMEQGIFEVIETSYDTPYGSKLNSKTLITGKGQVILVEKLRKEFN
ncbi:MAG: phage antirepressor KilAC domain-containing protein [Sarcina sp.]